jgi:hypothetical protein
LTPSAQRRRQLLDALIALADTGCGIGRGLQGVWCRHAAVVAVTGTIGIGGRHFAQCPIKRQHVSGFSPQQGQVGGPSSPARRALASASSA